MAKKPLNIGIVGYGFMGRTHANGYHNAAKFFDTPLVPVLKAACGRDAAKVKAYADNWGFESTETDWKKLIERKDIDAIDIVTPNDSHAEIAIAAARAGKMVLCEKPLSLDGPQGEEMVKEIDRRLRVIDQVIRHLVVRVDEELRVAERTRSARKATQARRRVARGLPPEPQPGESRGDSMDLDDDREGLEVQR
jgi:hypothetical protein